MRTFPHMRTCREPHSLHVQLTPAEHQRCCCPIRRRDCYWGAYDFLEKVRIVRGEKKSARRLAAEATPSTRPGRSSIFTEAAGKNDDGTRWVFTGRCRQPGLRICVMPCGFMSLGTGVSTLAQARAQWTRACLGPASCRVCDCVCSLSSVCAVCDQVIRYFYSFFCSSCRF